MSEKSTNFVPRKNIRMRKYICIIGLLLSCCLSTVADEVLTATLQHNGQMTPYFGDSAFYYANRMAQDGDTITLSPGWTFVGDTIRKSIYVIGSEGIRSSWSSGPESAFFGNPSSIRIGTSPIVCADNVHLEGLSINDLYIGSVSNCTIKRCGGNIRALSSTTVHTNTLIEQCDFYTDYAHQTAVNYVVRNTNIVEFYGMNTPANMATFTNCFIRDFYRQNSYNTQPYAIYTNCILGLDANARDYPERPFEPLPAYQFRAPSEFRYNYLYRWNSYNVAEYFVPFEFAPGCVNENNVVSSDSYSAIACYNVTSPPIEECYSYDRPNYIGPMIGSDGTQIGLRGGEIGFTQRSGIPHGWVPTYDEITDINGQWHMQFAYALVKAQPQDRPSLELIEYWVDDPYGQKQIITNASNTSQHTFDFSALKAGTHKFYYRYKDNYGAYSPLYVQSFERKNPYDEVLLLPYDATTLDEEQQTANPTYMAYPTEIETQMPTIQCDDTN